MQTGTAPRDRRTQQVDLMIWKQLDRSTHHNNRDSVYLELRVQLGAADGPGRRLIPIILHVTLHNTRGLVITTPLEAHSIVEKERATARYCT
jgi:hypothetical protein